MVHRKKELCLDSDQGGSLLQAPSVGNGMVLLISVGYHFFSFTSQPTSLCMIISITQKRLEAKVIGESSNNN